MSVTETQVDRRRESARWWVAAALILALALRIGAVFTSNINWDEFALFHKVDITEVTGTLVTGGRPGLAVVMLLPFLAECDDETTVIRNARLLWTFITVLWLAGLAVWIAAWVPESATRWRDAALGVCLLALVPEFLDSSIEVRTDQLAVLGGTWGGALLLHSRRRPALALLAGACLGAGVLGTQKLVYTAALVGLVTIGQLWMLREWRPLREGIRAAAVGLGFAAVLLAYRAFTAQAFELPPASAAQAPVTTTTLDAGLSLFEFYRNTIGFSKYRELLPQLIPHLALTVALALATVRAWREGLDDRVRLGLAWAALLLGVSVALFHAAAFSYFWMTLGLFPALAFAIAAEPLRRLVLPSAERSRRVIVGGFWLVLVVPAVMQMGFLLSDTQSVQRDSLAFVHRNFERDVAGFHPESGLFCQAGIQPVRTYFSQHLYQDFAGTSREDHTKSLIGIFRRKPIAFMLQSFRLNQFPVEVRRFWADNYQPYRGSVLVAGRRLEGRSGERTEIELVVPGRYRWLPIGDPIPVVIGGRPIAAGEIVSLESGILEIEFKVDVPAGLLVLALKDLPGPASAAFYR